MASVTLSGVSQLISFTHDICDALDSGFHINAIFLYFSKAFDLVSHQLLCHKLSTLNIDRNIISWIENLLSPIEHSSSLLTILTLLFVLSLLGFRKVLSSDLCFFSFMSVTCKTILSSIRLFADDCVIYWVISSSYDALTLQSDLNKISSWCNTWKMRLNSQKCKIIRISRSTAQLLLMQLLH